MIEFKNIDLSFNNRKVFGNFNLKVNRNEKVVLIAPSGKGKSSLFKLLLGFQKPDKGEIIFDEKVMNKNNLSYFRKNIAYVSQDVDLRKISVGCLIDEIFQYKQNRHCNIQRTQVEQTMATFKLSEDVLDKQVSDLSGGERQRIGIVICILLDRSVWLLDEVTAGLDKEMKEIVVDYVIKQDKTVIVISHDKIWSNNEAITIREW